MPGELLGFPSQAVERHAGHVEQVADAIRTARSAVHDVSMDNGAYGMLCQFLPGVLSAVFDLGGDALRGTADSLRETSAELRDTARDLVGTDRASAGRVTRAGRPPLPLPL